MQESGCAVISLFSFFILLLYVFIPHGGILAFITVIGIFTIVLFPLWVNDISRSKASSEQAKQIQRKINDIKKNNIVFIENSKSYAIPLHVWTTKIVLLHPTLVNVPEPSKNYCSQKEPYVSFSETEHLLSDVSLVNGIPTDPAFYAISQIASVAKDLYINIDPQNEDLRSKLAELQRLEKLARFSNLYNQQADLYSRAAKQIQELLGISYKLSRECSTFMVDILIGQELAKYNTDDLPDVLAIRLSLDNRCKLVSDQYQLLKSEMEEYMNLKNGI
jgi:hypothetical protein